MLLVLPARWLTCRSPQVLYYFLGKMLVLQPDSEHRFVQAHEAQHPMLPSGPGLYTLRRPGENTAALSLCLCCLLHFHHSFDIYRCMHESTAPTHTGHEQAAQQRCARAGLATSLVRSVSSECLKMGVIAQPHLDRVQQAVGNISPAGSLAGLADPPAVQNAPRAATLHDAELDLLNWPHPLDTLGNVQSYGPAGAISRHYPLCVTQACHALPQAPKASMLFNTQAAWQPSCLRMQHCTAHQYLHRTLHSLLYTRSHMPLR